MSEKMNTITMISIDKLQPHPDNPRKAIGDLQELADSIKAVGIMQNLTVVPFEDKYRILIGHRRHAAAKEAGLTELPCVIVDIPEDKQIEIMLIENMQRSDLTVLEEAQGLQLMMDMGNSIGKICEKTGFSESKVRHRIKMRDLDQDVLKERFDECQNISIMELQKLEQIKDPELRNDALKFIGTANFESKIKGAIAEEKYREWKAKVMTVLGDAQELKERGDKSFFIGLKDWDGKTDEGLEKIKALEGNVYYMETWHGFNVYVDKVEESSEEKAEREKREEAERSLRDRKAALNKILQRMKSLREDFIKGMSNRDCGYFLFYTPKVQKILLTALVDGELHEKKLLDLLDVQVENEPKYWENDEWEKLLIDATADIDIRKVLLCGLYLTIAPGEYDKTFDYYAKFEVGLKYQKTYEFMNLIGYQLSDEEKQILDGTHELYVKENEDEQE